MLSLKILVNFVFSISLPFPQGSQVALVVKNLPANVGDAGEAGLIPGWGRSLGGESGDQFQYSCLKNSMERGAGWAMVHGVTKSQT